MRTAVGPLLAPNGGGDEDDCPVVSAVYPSPLSSFMTDFVTVCARPRPARIPLATRLTHGS